MKTALIGDIGRYAVHDGPGIRTIVFFKGCPLHCPWCHNPEFIADRPEIAFYPDRCIGCGDCRDSCPESALTVDSVAHIDRRRCTGCGLCAPGCPTRALELVGRRYGVEELTGILLRDRLFYESSGGGVTLSGGEPTAQLEFCSRLLQRLKQEGIHTCIETNGFFDWDAFQGSALPYLDLILFDVKIADPSRHRQIIGTDNALIMVNLKRLLAMRPESVIPRIPLIPGFTADAENISRLAMLFEELQVRRCSLLAYHIFGRTKTERVGKTAESVLQRKSMTREMLHEWQRFFHGMEIVEP